MSGRVCPFFEPVLAGIAMMNWHDNSSIARFRLNCPRLDEIGLRTARNAYSPVLAGVRRAGPVSIVAGPAGFCTGSWIWALPIGVPLQTTKTRRKSCVQLPAVWTRRRRWELLRSAGPTVQKSEIKAQPAQYIRNRPPVHARRRSQAMSASAPVPAVATR